MKILLLTHSFNSLTQRIYVELANRGHELSVEFDIHDDVTLEACQLFEPDLVIAPFLKRAIPENVWQNWTCLIVHPGPVGDRGPSALDWAILNGEKEWGVTLLQAEAEMDAGPIWASRTFPMRVAPKSSLYRNEVTEGAVECVIEALEKIKDPSFKPTPLEGAGKWQPAMAQSIREIDWEQDDPVTVVRKINSADGHPGVKATLRGMEVYLHHAKIADKRFSGRPKEILATRHGAVCLACHGGAIWVGYLRPKRTPNGPQTFKLPATHVLGFEEDAQNETEITYEEKDNIGYLHFPFHNGAMNTLQCERLLEAYTKAASTSVKALVLMGGEDFFSNGIHLNAIEGHERPAEESLKNIEAMDDLCEAIIKTTDKVTIAALSGNAGAGGVFFALTCDQVMARAGIILTPHYKNMGNLYGSEFWTYLLPKRVGAGNEDQVMGHRLPIGTSEGLKLGLIDQAFGKTISDFKSELHGVITRLDLDRIIEAKTKTRLEDEKIKPLLEYRDEELERMKLNFFGFDPSYHVARYKFVLREPKSHTPLHLARHRQRISR